MAGVFSVSQINAYLKQVIGTDSNLQNIFVSGEISNFKNTYASGHCYFSLKDSKTSIRAVMFAGNARKLMFTPEDGMKVIVTGSVSVYEAQGSYQLIVESMQPDGKGAIALAYEQLKNKLRSRGVFDSSRKRPIPILPRRIGVVTSASGAVIEDIKNVVSRRCPFTEVVLYPSAVQGEGAGAQLKKGIDYFNEKQDVDVIIIGRGGGSFEDLFCFNDEALIWAIYHSTIPIISAVGHETDMTLCDYAADLRAPTPSAAAELAVPNSEDLKNAVGIQFLKMKQIVGDKLQTAYQDIDRLKDAVAAIEPKRYIENEEDALMRYKARMNRVYMRTLEHEQERIDTLADKINALSPIRLLKKGYTVTTKNDKCVTSADDIAAGDEISVSFADGKALCTVNTITKREV